MPSCPLCRAEFPQMTGLRLFDSANECAICFENCAEMIALFCGHQFCRQDLETLGFVIPQETQVQAQPAQVQAQPAPSNFVDLTVSLPIVRARRRCGWCGHMGHTQRKCRIHKLQCRCKTFKRARHKRMLATKHTCPLCNKKGHSPGLCDLVVPGFR